VPPSGAGANSDYPPSTIDFPGNVSGSAVRNRDVNRDHPRACRPSDHRERLWDRARKIAPHHLRFFFQNPKAILRH
jgi:hypothetical protein